MPTPIKLTDEQSLEIRQRLRALFQSYEPLVGCDVAIIYFKNGPDGKYMGFLEVNRPPPLQELAAHLVEYVAGEAYNLGLVEGLQRALNRMETSLKNDPEKP